MIYIRTDMNDIIATGHMMRCLAIADAAKSMGEDTIFIVSDNEAATLLEEKGYDYIVLHTNWNDMDSELEVLKTVILKCQIKRMLVDSYQITPNYFEKLQELIEVYYIDDLNEYIYPVKGLICYEVNWDSRNYEQRYSNAELMITIYTIKRGFL